EIPRYARNDTAYLLARVLVRHHPSPKTLCSPDTGTQAFQLNDLAVIDKQIHVCTVVFDVPFEHIWIGGFKHQFLHADFVYEFRGNVRAPRIDVSSNALAFDHDDLRSGFEEWPCLSYGPV